MRFFAAALIFFGAASHGQSPVVPHKIQFAGMTLTIKEDARREIQKDVDALTQSPRYFNIKLERAKTYFPMIEQIFREERLPDDFKFLVLQESALISDAVSVSNAVGYWQFKDFTAEEMGMRVDKQIDERMNLLSSTRAAARYIKKNNYYFNNWVYALQAYQMGAGGVMRAVGDKYNGARHMDIDGDTYWYVKKFLAHKVAFEDALKGEPQLKLVPHEVNSQTTLSRLAKELNTDEGQLAEYNKWALKGEIPNDKKYTVLVPVGEYNTDFNRLSLGGSPATETVVISNAGPAITTINQVPAVTALPEERLTQLADRAGVSLNAFMRYNDISIDHNVIGGRAYFIAKKKSRTWEPFHKVEEGETLWDISQAYGVKLRKLRKYNRLNDHERVAKNTMLWLSYAKPRAKEVPVEAIQLDEDRTFDWARPASSQPAIVAQLDSAPAVSSAPASAMPVEAKKDFHEVQASDTLYGVARQYGLTVKELMDWNGKKDFTLEVGEKLRLNPH
ncbi:MAG: LysM peptidoglycan-binding domain-containing protein [Cyclobacteriaceae bacterium]